MKYTDLSGVIRPGIWTYGELYPDFKPRSIMVGDNTYFCEVFDGMASHTGTYLETVAHFNGYEGQPMLEDLPLSRMMNVPCHIVKLLPPPYVPGQRHRLTRADFETAMQGMNVQPGDAILFCCGWNDWENPDFLEGGPYLSREAMEFLMELKPGILGSDLPSWEHDEGVFEIFSKNSTLLLAPLLRLESLPASGLLTVLPVNIGKTCCAPARAVFCSEE